MLDVMYEKPKSRMVKRVCTECGDEFELYCTVVNSTTLCQACRDERDRIRDRERRAQNRQENAYNSNKRRADANKIYKMIYDPDESWGYNTHLSDEDIKMAIKMRNIREGCRFMNINTGKTSRIIYVKKGRVKGLLHKKESEIRKR